MDDGTRFRGLAGSGLRGRLYRRWPRLRITMWRIVLYGGVCCSYLRLWYGKFRLQITSRNIIRYLTLHVAHSFDSTKSVGPSRLLNVAEQYSSISSLKVVVQYMAILYKSLHWSLAPLFLDLGTLISQLWRGSSLFVLKNPFLAHWGWRWCWDGWQSEPL